MNGAGLVDIARTLLARTFHQTTDMLIRRWYSSSNTIRLVPHRCSCSDAGQNESNRRETCGNSVETATDRNPLSCNQPRADFDVVTVREKILSNTVLSRHHLTPEIALHLITPDCAIYHRPVGAVEDDPNTIPFTIDPFWGFFWPGGQALTRFILDTGRLFRGKSVLDVGCGCGASSIAAKLVGASYVTANDIDPAALQATLMNAKANGIKENADKLEINEANLIGNGVSTIQHDIVLIGDLFYDAEIAANLHPWIQHMARAGKKIFIGDPGRHGVTATGLLSNMALKARYELPENVCLENNGFSHANVWQYRLIR